MTSRHPNHRRPSPAAAPAPPPVQLNDLGFGSVVSRERNRLLNRDGTFNARREGASLTDRLSPYQSLLTMSWPPFLALFTLAYLAINSAFAVAYYLLGPSGVTPGPQLAPMGGRFMTAFFFSIETFSTIGYGNILPNGLVANLVVSAESMAGILFVALATGLIFARFSRPLLHIRFSDHAVIAPYRNGTAFMFRLGNTRRSELVNVSAQVTFARFERVDGAPMRYFAELALERQSVQYFPLTWTIVHPIDEQSPLRGVTQQDLIDARAEFLVTLTATEDTFSQVVHTRTSYVATEVQWGARFSSVYTSPEDDGVVTIDLRKIDEVEPTPLPEPTAVPEPVSEPT